MQSVPARVFSLTHSLVPPSKRADNLRCNKYRSEQQHPVCSPIRSSSDPGGSFLCLAYVSLLVLAVPTLARSLARSMPSVNRPLRAGAQVFHLVR
jgi:hypothetical protein